MAFLQSAPPREPFLHAPGSVLWLIVALLAVYLLSFYGPLPDSFWNAWVFVPARFLDGVTLAAALPLISHMFLHGGLLHLAMNCLWLLPFGTYISRRYGAGYFYGLFFTAGIAGALTHLAFHWGSADAVIGASGGVAGLMGAGMRMLRWPGLSSTQRLAPLTARPILIFTGLWLATNLIFGFIGFEGQTIAWEAHVGGYVFGLLAIGLIDRLRFGHSAG